MIKKSEKGSITLFTLIAMMFFLTIAFTAYASAMAKLQAQNEDLERIKASYEQDLTPEGLASLYEELTTKKPYTVTFDANGGTVDLPSKEVKYGKEYGKLPTPTRDGYKFMGWNGKNLFNYDKNEYYHPATIKEKMKNKDGYMRNINYISNSIWPIFWADKKNIELENSGIYTISFDVWADENTSFSNNRLFVNNSTSSTHNLSNLTREVQRLKSTITYIENTNNAGGGNIIHIYPRTSSNNNIYISDVQIEEGTEATEYEPYYITSDTKVTQKKDHTLTAIWDEGVPPTLELSKETYIEEDFSDWTLNNARVMDEDGKKVLIIGEDGNAGGAISNYYETHGEKWVPNYEAFVTVASTKYSPNGGIMNTLHYYNNNFGSTNDWSGQSANGVAFKCELNKWIPSTVDYRYKLDTKCINGYGNDIKYIKINIYTNEYSQPPVKIRNFKMIGEAIPNSFYDIKITSSDNVGVTTTKYAKGEQTAEYFETNGINVENNQIRVTENGVYTVCVGDKAGNKAVKTIEITNIQ